MKTEQEEKQTGTTVKIKIHRGLCYMRLDSTDGWEHPERRAFRKLCLLRWVSFSVFCTCTYLFLFPKYLTNSSTSLTFYFHHLSTRYGHLLLG